MIYITHFRAKNVCHRILSIQAHVLENADVALEFEYRAYNYANFTLPVIYWDSYGGRKKTRRRRISWFGLHINGNFITIFSFITCCSMMDVYRAFFFIWFLFSVLHARLRILIFLIWPSSTVLQWWMTELLLENYRLFGTSLRMESNLIMRI